MVNLTAWDFIEQVVLGAELSIESTRDEIGSHVAYVKTCNATMRCLNDGAISLVDSQLNVVKLNRTKHDVLPILIFKQEVKDWCHQLYRELSPIMSEFVGKSNLFYWAGVCSKSIFLGEQKFGLTIPSRERQLEYIKLAAEALNSCWNYEVDGNTISIYYHGQLVQQNNISTVKQFAHRVRHA